MNRFMIAGTKSGCGKTSITCGILSALKKRGLNVTSFKCGPDYIDPMFHRQIMGIKSHNLDSFFCDDNTLRYILNMESSNCDTAVIEGVMGFYDGETGSACSVSQKTNTPVILVIDCKGMSDSIGALVSGFLNYRQPNNIKGFIFNRLPERLIPLVREICNKFNTEYLGCFPQNKFTFESRHLGLVTANEVEDINKKISGLGELAERYILIDRLLEIDADLISGYNPEYNPPEIPVIENPPVIAVARDKAFCFIYDENIELLERMGCNIEYFSPLDDKKLPENISGLILYGGYPELYAKQLSENSKLMNEIRLKIKSGMPVIAECGGFMYLHKILTTKDGEFSMVGIIDGKAFPCDRLQRFGYINMKAYKDNILCHKNEIIKAHEFHYWDSTDCGKQFYAEKKDGRNWKCGHISETMYAGFPHIYFYSDIKIAERFVKACINYGGKDEKDK